MELDVKRVVRATGLMIESPDGGIELYEHASYTLRHLRVDSVEEGLTAAVKSGADYFYIEDCLIASAGGRLLQSRWQNTAQGHIADRVLDRDSLMEELKDKTRRLPLQSVALMFENAAERPTALHSLLYVLEKQPAGSRYAVFTEKDAAAVRAVRIDEGVQVLNRLGARLWPLPEPVAEAAPEAPSPGRPPSSP